MTINTYNQVCHKCGQPAMFYDGSNGYWWCGMNYFAHGYCKREKQKGIDEKSNNN